MSKQSLNIKQLPQGQTRGRHFNYDSKINDFQHFTSIFSQKAFYIQQIINITLKNEQSQQHCCQCYVVDLWRKKSYTRNKFLYSLQFTIPLPLKISLLVDFKSHHKLEDIPIIIRCVVLFLLYSFFSCMETFFINFFHIICLNHVVSLPIFAPISLSNFMFSFSF